MRRSLKYILLIHLLLCTHIISKAHAEICTGVRIYNNQWQETWLMTAAPEVSLKGKWLALQFDGTFGTYSPKASPQNYILQSRMSAIPMINLNMGVLETMIGYGFAYQFLREEIYTEPAQWTFSSTQETSGEFRFLLGLGFSVSDRMNLHLNGGYHFINEDNSAYSFGMSFGFKSITGASDSPKPENIKPRKLLSPPEKDVISTEPEIIAEEAEEPQTKIIPPVSDDTALIKTVCIIGTEDPFINEVNADIESAFRENGIRIIDWEKIRAAAWQQYEHSYAENSNATLNPSDFFLTNSQILYNVADAFDLNAVIETKLRYVYETYGGEISVNAAYVRAIHPKSGKVLFSINHEKLESSFSDCKSALISELVLKLKEYK